MIRKDLKTFAHSSSLIFDSFNRIVLSKGISQIVIKHCSHQGILLAHLARWMTLCELENIINTLKASTAVENTSVRSWGKTPDKM